MQTEIDNNQYQNILKDVISEIKSTRYILATRINTSMMQMHWNIGKRLFEEGLDKRYGNNIVEKLSIDLKYEFPGTNGFSPRNLWDMKRFYEFYYQADEKLRHSVAVLPWKHNILIMTYSKSIKEAHFYVTSALEMGWTRDILLNFIKADAYNHSKTLPKLHNFKNALPEHLQEQADEILKSTYNLEFLRLSKPFKESELEKRLVEKIKLFLLELGQGFSFIGNQYRLTLGQKEYFIDLLGIILCADKDHIEVEVSLRDINKPIGIANYQLQFPEKQLKELIIKEMNQ